MKRPVNRHLKDLGPSHAFTHVTVGHAADPTKSAALDSSRAANWKPTINHRSNSMHFQDYITTQRQTAPKPGADIRSRWVSRVVARGLQTQGRAGADAYLRDYGRGIAVAKIIAFALHAESEGCGELAAGFWAAAYTRQTGRSAPASEMVPAADALGVATAAPAPAPMTTNFPDFPQHLQPGAVLTMQPVDTNRTRDDLIADPAYIAQPKRDGCRIVVFASPDHVAYQSRSTSLVPSPGAAFDQAFLTVARARGQFILDGELLFLDHCGGEHRTGSQAATANAGIGSPDAPVVCVIAVFKALYARGLDLSGHDELTRIRASEPFVELAQDQLAQAGVIDSRVDQVPTAWTPNEKLALTITQRSEGREGEVWIQRSTTYRPGKTGGEIFVRTKYVEETEVVITGLTPTTVAGRAFGAIDVAARYPDGSLRPVGKVGTGFDQAEAGRIRDLFSKHPNGLRISVRHQGRTEAGQLWHARFQRIIGPVGERT